MVACFMLRVAIKTLKILRILLIVNFSPVIKCLGKTDQIILDFC